MTDDERENRIDTAALQMQHAKTPAARRYWWEEMKRLIEGRSQRQVEKMERERGIYTEPKS